MRRFYVSGCEVQRESAGSFPAAVSRSSFLFAFSAFVTPDSGNGAGSRSSAFRSFSAPRRESSTWISLTASSRASAESALGLPRSPPLDKGASMSRTVVKTEIDSLPSASCPAAISRTRLWIGQSMCAAAETSQNPPGFAWSAGRGVRPDLVAVGVAVRHEDHIGEAQQKRFDFLAGMVVAVRVGHRVQRVVTEDDDQLVLHAVLRDGVAVGVEVVWLYSLRRSSSQSNWSSSIPPSALFWMLVSPPGFVESRVM